MQKYIMILNDKSRIIEMLSSATFEDYARVQKQFASDLNKPQDWICIKIFRLFENQKISNVYYTEEYYSDGASFTLIKMPDVTDVDIEMAKNELCNGRDVIDLEVIEIKSFI
jgi:hypothetical protein